LHMDVKESLLESVRQGASMGYGAYDFSHDIRLCRHCPDNACAPATPLDPFPPNICDDSLCSQCFRENEAREAAVSGAIGAAALLSAYQFDADFTVALSQPDVEAFLKSDPASKNGFALDYLRFRDDLRIEIESGRFDISGSSRIPKGTVVRDG